mmetsp:Transcript_115055/g.245776  ORF Transcript_115055/g.245776 Transcript_115055/m.245776 type:complete len:231 (-) Transcript_115055:1593-2285(-)
MRQLPTMLVMHIAYSMVSRHHAAAVLIGSRRTTIRPIRTVVSAPTTLWRSNVQAVLTAMRGISAPGSLRRPTRRHMRARRVLCTLRSLRTHSVMPHVWCRVFRPLAEAGLSGWLITISRSRRPAVRTPTLSSRVSVMTVAAHAMSATLARERQDQSKPSTASWTSIVGNRIGQSRSGSGVACITTSRARRHRLRRQPHRTATQASQVMEKPKPRLRRERGVVDTNRWDAR